MGPNSVAIANGLMTAVNNASYRSAIKYMLPFLGADILAAKVPLIDDLNVGIPTNTGFVNANFAENAGITSDGTKHLDTLIKPSQLGDSNNGGVGIYLKTPPTISYPVIGAYDVEGTTQLFGLTLYGDGDEGDSTFDWGNGFGTTGAIWCPPGHYFGQRDSNTSRKLFKDGVQRGSTNTSGSVSVSAIAVRNIMVGASHPDYPADGVFSYAYMTNGTLTPANNLDLHSLFQIHLMGPTSR
jgi:hypothetical protein